MTATRAALRGVTEYLCNSGIDARALPGVNGIVIPAMLMHVHNTSSAQTMIPDSIATWLRDLEEARSASGPEYRDYGALVLRRHGTSLHRIGTWWVVLPAQNYLSICGVPPERWPAESEYNQTYITLDYFTETYVAAGYGTL